MKKLSVLLALLIAFTLTLPATAGAASPDYSYIRVRLDSMKNPAQVQFKLNGTYRIPGQAAVDLYPNILYTLKPATTGSGTTLSYSNGVKTVSVSLPASITLKQYDNGSATNFLYLNDPSYGWHYYAGDMTLRRPAGTKTMECINRVFLETYLYGVVAYEMSDSWPVEALKAQAVAARTYAMRFQQSNSAKDYDIGDTTSNQVYKGYPFGSDGKPQKNVIAAVDATRGMVVTYNGTLVDGMFSASNGGQIRVSATGTGTASGYHVFKDDPYDLANASSPSFRYIFPAVNNSPTMNLLSTTDKNKVNAMFTLLREKLVPVIKAQTGIVCTADKITINGITAVTPTALRSGVPKGSREFTQVAVTVKVTVPGTPVTPPPTTPPPTTPPPTTEPPTTEPTEPSDEPSTEPSVEPSSDADSLAAKAATTQSAKVSATAATYTDSFTVKLQYTDNAGTLIGELKQRFSSFHSLIATRNLWNMYLEKSSDGRFFYLTVRGYGHGVGLSQRGAQQMANKGKKYDEILAFYYNVGTKPEVKKTTVALKYQTLTKVPGNSKPKYGKVSSSTPLNVRATTDSSKGTIVGTVKKGEYVEILSSPKSGWYRVLYQKTGLIGNVVSKYVTKVSSTPKPSVSATPKPTATPKPVTGVVGSSNLNMRKSPASGAAVVTVIPKKSTVTVLDTKAASGWYKVKYKTYTGYCMSKYITLAKPTATPKPIATPKPANNKTVSAKANVTDYLSLRASASSSAKTLAKIPKNGTFTVLSVHTSPAWLKVTYSGKTGYVLAKYASIEGSSAYKAFTVTASTLNVRKSASSSAAVLGKLAKGNTVTITATSKVSGKTWYKIRFGSSTGYILSGYGRVMTK